MPKAVKDHRSKKNPQSHEVWLRRKREANAADDRHQWFQGDFRRRAIIDRMGTERFTAKNQKEADAMGIKGIIKRME